MADATLVGRLSSRGVVTSMAIRFQLRLRTIFLVVLVAVFGCATAAPWVRQWLEAWGSVPIDEHELTLEGYAETADGNSFENWREYEVQTP